MAHLENEQINANALIDKMVKKSRAAQSSLGKSDFATRCAALQAAAAAIRAQITAILDANVQDVARAIANGINQAFIDRLTLDEARIESMATGLEAMIKMPDPVGAELARWQQPNGLDIARISTPLGVIGIIYESRPKRNN